MIEWPETKFPAINLWSAPARMNEKYKIKIEGDYWKCSYAGMTAYGCSPKEAFFNWRLSWF